MRIKPTKIKFIRFVQLVVPLNQPRISTNFRKLTFVVRIYWWIEKCFINLWCLHADGDFWPSGRCAQRCAMVWGFQY